jgi:hypothetical protein
MRELEGPWLHFFGPEDSGDDAITSTGITGALFTADSRAAKGDESYGGLSADAIGRTTGFSLQVAVQMPQPLLFDDPTITGERFPYVDGQAWPGPPQRSATWDREYAAFKRGEHLALPYFDAHATDPDKQSALAADYQKYLRGALDARDLPDLSNIYPDDAQTRAEIGLQSEPSATPAESLIQACGGCHNDVLDQMISRARFNVAVARLPAAELTTAIDRIGRSRDEPGAMPPPDARALDPHGREALIQYLEAANFSDDERAQLEHAATAGMAGNTQQAQ